MPTATLRIDVETVVYEPGEPDEETLHEVECYLVGNGTQQVQFEYSLNSIDYPTDPDIQNFITTDLTSKGLVWDSVEINHTP